MPGPPLSRAPAASAAEWELQALGQLALEQLLRRTLDRRLPEPLERVREREAAERWHLAEYLDRYEAAS